jgi:hypothetical protein
MVRILINWLLVLGLSLGAAPASAVVVHELSRTSTETETPLEREEAVARSAVSRSTSQLGAKHQRFAVTGRFIIATAARTDRSQRLALTPSTDSPPRLHQMYGVYRI